MKSAIENSREHGWLPHPGPEHTRAVVSIALFILIYISQGFGFARLAVMDRSPDVNFRYEGTISVEDAGGYSASVEGSLAGQLAFERAQNIEGDMSGFGIVVLAGLFLSGRPRWGAKVGIAAGVLGLVGLIGARAQVASDFQETDWPFPVEARLDFGWGFWIGLSALAAAILWNVFRLRADRREAFEISEARS